MLIGSDRIDERIAAGKLATAGRADFAKSGVGVAVRTGVPKPDIATSDALKAAVLAANSVVYSAGPSGGYVAELLKTMGIAEQVAGKIKAALVGCRGGCHAGAWRGRFRLPSGKKPPSLARF